MSSPTATSPINGRAASAESRPYDLIAFDWDGTLVDSIGAIVACTEAALGELGLASPGVAAIRATIGLGLEETAARYLPRVDRASLDQLTASYRRHWFGGWGTCSALFEEVVTVVSTLRAAGYRLAIATAKGRRGLRADLERLGLERHFDATRTAEESAGKPDPLMLHQLMEQLGATPERTLMVGDAVWDLRMARNAATAAVGVASGAESREALVACDPLAVLERVGELPRWLATRRA